METISPMMQLDHNKMKIRELLSERVVHGYHGVQRS